MPANGDRPHVTSASTSLPLLAPARRIRLLILDAQPVVRCGIRLFVEDSWKLLTIFEAESAEEAIAVALRVKPTIVLLDAWLPDMLFPEAVERLRAASPAARFVLFAAHLAPAIRGEAVGAGIQAILGKDASPQQFRDVVSRVAAGEVVVPPPRNEILRRAAGKLHRAPLPPHDHEIP